MAKIVSFTMGCSGNPIRAIARFLLRNLPDLRKAPSTSELIDWIGALVKGGVSESELSDRVPYLGSLIKKEQDLETLAFQKRRADLNGGE